MPTYKIPRKNKLYPEVFHDVALAIEDDRFTHYALRGGRGSCKSSFLAIMLILMAKRNPGCHAAVFRRFAVNLSGSVYNRLLWAMSILRMSGDWKCRRSPLELEHVNGNRIIFLGGDEPEKIKSITPKSGYFKYVWFEEFSEFACEEDIRSILQSLMRGGEKFGIFYSYNPPKSNSQWTNVWAMEPRDDRVIHRSSYVDVPENWLGTQFFLEAKRLKELKPIAYAHEYGGEITGSGGQVFDNLEVRPIADEEISRFATIYRGLDFGFACDPAAYISINYEKSSQKLYIFRETYKTGMSNGAIVDAIKEENPGRETVIADSAEPRTISELQGLGCNLIGARKGPDSVRSGMKWLQDRTKIIIDPARTPNAAREFQGYEYERDKYGNFRSDFPDRDNHAIDAVRYACEELRIGEVGPSIALSAPRQRRNW